MMLIELWEHLRGYDKWTPAVATVQSTELSRVGEIGDDKSKAPLAAGWKSRCKIGWRDLNQIEHMAVFEAFEDSALYQLFEGDTVDIRISPAKPSEYYLPGLIQSRFSQTWRLALYTLMFIILGIGFLAFLLAH